MDWKAWELWMLTLMVWREARGESADGIAAVVHSVLNRVAKPSWWGKNVLEVVSKKFQYSSIADPKDIQLTKWPKPGEESFAVVHEIVVGVLSGLISNPVPTADSYYDISISAPFWATPENFVKQVGRLRFHNVDKQCE